MSSLQTAVIVHQYTKFSTSLSTSKPGAATGAGVGGPQGAAGPGPGKTTDTVQPLCVNTVGEPHTIPDKSVEP